MLILVTGGAGSGKSLLAERISMQLKRMPFWYVATMQVWDQECRDRIDRHRRQRAGKGFQTVEAPVHLAEAAAALPPDGTALLECLSNLVANEQFGGDTGAPVQAVLDGVHALYRNVRHLVIVTNEVFSDGTPADPAMHRCAGLPHHRGLQDLRQRQALCPERRRRCGRGRYR